MVHDVAERLAFVLASENVIELAFGPVIAAVAVVALKLVELPLLELAVAELVAAFEVND